MAPKTPSSVYVGQAQMGRLASAIIILLGLIVGLRVAIPYFQQRGGLTTNTVNPQATPQPRNTGFSFLPGINSANNSTNNSTNNPSVVQPQPAVPQNPGATGTQIYNPPATTLPANPYPPNTSGPPGGVTGGW
jgi:hypothetical protein